MKKLLSAVALMMVASTSYAMTYECWTYIGGHPDKMLNRSADNKADAERMAADWFQSNGYKFDYIKCH